MSAPFIEMLSNEVYTSSGIEMAREYVFQRGLNPDLFRFPWTVTPSNVRFSQWVLKASPFPVSTYTDSLFIPIVDFFDPSVLIGFDIRYLGSDPKRIRYRKIQRDPDVPLLYFTHSLDESMRERSCVLVEGATDCESLRGLGVPIITPLTTKSTLGFIIFIWSIFENVFLCYDNDYTGRSATERIVKMVAPHAEAGKRFTSLVYSAKDPNQALTMFGRGYLDSVLKPQIERVLT